MENRFDLFFEILMEKEGFESNDKNDSGGYTKYGLSTKTYPNLDLRNITKEQAKEVYYNDFYRYFEPVESDLISYELFDTSVNMGVKRAVLMLQETINFGRFGKVVVDGVIGNQTTSVLNNLNDYIRFHNYYLIFKSKRYFDLVRENEKLNDFIFGWIDKRVVNGFELQNKLK